MTASPLRRSVISVVAGESLDAVVLARIQAGDDVALGAVYDQHSGLVFGLARRVTRDEQLARDITQDVFAYLWELPGRVDLARGSLRSYLAVVTHRRAVDEVRRNERRKRTEAAVPVVATEDGPEAGSSMRRRRRGARAGWPAGWRNYRRSNAQPWNLPTTTG
jgi:DNA-directed RNA polymerase specialized sigma24 family protein